MDWVLIVDDDDESLARASGILTDAGARVTGLSSGEEFLDYIEGMVPLPDLLLLDISMPGMSGFETMQKLIERNAAASEVPVIFLTGNEDLDSELEGFGLGAADFIRKGNNKIALISAHANSYRYILCYLSGITGFVPEEAGDFLRRENRTDILDILNAKMMNEGENTENKT